MDQMTSSCGEANKLLAMICQVDSAEVIGLVEIPNHVRFWGIDSRIRHSVGGADYGSVRVKDEGIELLETEASLDYLCNLSPHGYEARYADKLPDFLLDPPIFENFWVKTFKALLTSAMSNLLLLDYG
uniref:Uncharacterized protein n=1 Tax=Brassica oleracea TaxID=3712 RepID=A0A3P6GFZ7_BRAOL|nr:unnamed protein product [Brassica oleracea]